MEYLSKLSRPLTGEQSLNLGIEPNPHLETLSKAVDLARNKQVTHVLAVGGGSVIDGSKFITAGLYIQTTYGKLSKRTVNTLPRHYLWGVY